MKRTTNFKLSLIFLADLVFGALNGGTPAFALENQFSKEISSDSLKRRIEQLPNIKDVQRLESGQF